tara:strand:+ start:2225 stop:2797 length:573 start_codon:yes stop_codon:yes gene_type:complete
MNEKRKKIVKILESWYLVDSILFNNHAKKVITKGKDFKEYVTMKASFLSNLYEMWDHIGYVPNMESDVSSVKILKESAVISAKKGKSLSSDIMMKDGSIQKIKSKVIKESKDKENVDVTKLSEKIIREKFVQMTLDNCLVGIPLLESKETKKLSGEDFKGEILADSYKMIRDSLIHLSRTAKMQKTCCGK